MKSREIGTIFNHPEYGKLQVCAEGAENECYGCVFHNPKCCSNDPDHIHTGACAMDLRSDGQGVLWWRKWKGVRVATYTEAVHLIQRHKITWEEVRTNA